MRGLSALSSGDLRALAAALADFDVPGFDFDSGLLIEGETISPKSLATVPVGSQEAVSKVIEGLARGEYPMSVHHLEAHLLGLAEAREELEACRREVQLLWSGPTYSAVPSYDEAARVRQVCRAARERITFLCGGGDANPRSAWGDLRGILEGLTVEVRFIVGSPPSHREEPAAHHAARFGGHLEAEGVLDKTRTRIFYHTAPGSAFTLSGVLVDRARLVLTSSPCPWSLSEAKLSVGVQMSSPQRVAELTALLDAMQAGGELAEVDLDELEAVSGDAGGGLGEVDALDWLDDLLYELDIAGIEVGPLLPVFKLLNAEETSCCEVEGDDGMVVGACHLFWPVRRLGVHFDEDGDAEELRAQGWTIHVLDGTSPRAAEALRVLLREEGLA